VAEAVRLSPTHRRQAVEGFGDVRQYHDVLAHATRTMEDPSNKATGKAKTIAFSNVGFPNAFIPVPSLHSHCRQDEGTK
jgi:hypothetical protein